MLRVSEVMAKNDSAFADEHGEFDDWVEITNIGDTAVSLAGVSLSDSADNLEKFTFADDASIEPGAYLVVFCDDAPDQGPLHAPFKLKSEGEPVLLSRAGEIIDSVAYPPLCADDTYGRPDGENAFDHLATPTPGAANGAAAPSTPECGESLPDGGVPPDAELTLNEIVPLNETGLLDETNTPTAWVELYNPGTEPAVLSFHTLSDDPEQPAAWRFPFGTTVEADAYLVVFLDGEPQDGPLHAAFVPSLQGGTVTLHAPDGDELSRLTYPAPGPDRAYDVDGAALSTPTPGAANATGFDGGLPDAAHLDAGGTDASAPDASGLDAGNADAQALDAGSPDAQAPDAGDGG